MNVGLLISGISWILGAIILLVISHRFLNNPGSPNRVSGYRTTRSMASLENWVRLNSVAMRRFKFCSYILLALGCLLLWLAKIVPSDLLITIALGIAPIVVVTIPAVLTFLQEEKLLDRHRHDDGW